MTIIIAGLVVLAIVGIVIYNRLIRSRNRVSRVAGDHRYRCTTRAMGGKHRSQ